MENFHDEIFQVELIKNEKSVQINRNQTQTQKVNDLRIPKGKTL